MRLAILSDIHGNYEAFKQVLLDLDRANVDSEICLGDCIGYGPEPEETIREVMQRKIPSILGNHEMAAVDLGGLVQAPDDLLVLAKAGEIDE